MSIPTTAVARWSRAGALRNATTTARSGPHPQQHSVDPAAYLTVRCVDERRSARIARLLRHRGGLVAAARHRPPASSASTPAPPICAHLVLVGLQGSARRRTESDLRRPPRSSMSSRGDQRPT